MNDIKLSPVTESDLELIRRWRNSEEVSAFMYTDDKITSEQQKAWFEKISQSTNSYYWIIEYEGKKLGLASVTEISKTFDSCFWGFYLGETVTRGTGVGSKVEFNILKFVFEELGLNKIRGEVLVTNQNVIKMHEKFGFRREAYFREHVVKNGEKTDVIGIAMLKSEWLTLKDYLLNKIYNKN